MKNKDQYEIGQIVSWQWIGKSIIGVIKEIHYGPVVRIIKGKSICRNGSLERPAYLVETLHTKKIALKLGSELTEAI